MEKNYLRIVWILAFAAFALISCWATAESLHMLLSSWPTFMCWIVSVGFFIIASVGTKMIVDSLNTNVYIEKRGSRLAFGVVLVLVFWLVCSMPTNTHTFLYRSVVSDIVTKDIDNTQNYLNMVTNNTKNKDVAFQKANDLRNKVDIKLGELEAEIMNEAAPGFGPKSKEILAEFAQLFDVAKVEPLAFNGTSKQDLQKLKSAYRNKIYTLRDNRCLSIANNILRPSEANLKTVARITDDLNILKNSIANDEIDLFDAEYMTSVGGVCDKLTEGYNAVKNNKDFVTFNSEDDEMLYTAPSPTPRVSRLISVFDAWHDFLAGEFAGKGFLFWIVISALVDIAAFIFFDLAFRKSDY